MESLSSTNNEPVVAFVSKMVAVPEKDLPENKNRAGKSLTADEAREMGRRKRAEIARAQAAANGENADVAELREALNGTGISDDRQDRYSTVAETEDGHVKERIIGFARLFSGELSVGDEVYVLPPKFTPLNPYAAPEPQRVTITALYLLMGRELESLTTVPPGVIFGIGGLEGHVMKSGTLCSQVEGGVNLAGVAMGGEPIVRVALEPENPMDLDKMVVGLRLLEQSDPCARYEVLENGEHVILTAGELHLERCLNDLRERFAKCDIQAGASIVPYRESIISASEMNPPKHKELPRGTVATNEPNKLLGLRLRVMPLPQAATEFLAQNSSLAKDLYEERSAEEDAAALNDDVSGAFTSGEQSQGFSQGQAHTVRALEKLRDGLRQAFSSSRGNRETWRDVTDNIVALGPRRVGPNILVDSTPDNVCRSMQVSRKQLDRS